VSAFCNAGFSTFSDSLVGFGGQPGVLLVVSLLVVLGGFGYLSSAEVLRWARPAPQGRSPRLSTHTVAALAVTLGLLAAGTACFALFEWRGVLAPFGAAGKLVNAWFMAVTPRTAGFNSVAYGEVSNVTATLTVILMFIGGSPGSTAGGVKTTALAVLVVLALARIRGRRYVELHRRAIPEATIQRTVILVLVAFALVTACVFLLSWTETHAAPLAVARQAFLPLCFEAVSAFGTVGLSMGVTPELSTAGKLVIILLMFVGRVGPLSFFAAIALRSAGRPADFRPAHEDLIVG
jgi:trk system potassium uptake protein TrkH